MNEMKTTNVVLAVFLFVLILGCDGDIDTSIGPDDNKPSYEEALIRRLSGNPFQTWSPFGDRIIFCQDGDIWLMDNDGSNLQELIIFPDAQESASHPDWKIYDRIVFQLNYPNGSEICSKRAFSGVTERVNFDLPEPGLSQYQFPTLSSDGKYIVFTFNDNMYLSEYPPRGRASLIEVSEKINKSLEWVGMYSWSADEKIAFVAKTSEGTNIYVMDDIRTKTVVQITKGNIRDFNPSWSPDGKYIAFDSNRENIASEHNICLVKSDGTGLKILIKSAQYPRFHPSDNKLLYSAQRVEGWKIGLIHNVIQKE